MALFFVCWKWLFSASMLKETLWNIMEFLWCVSLNFDFNSSLQAECYISFFGFYISISVFFSSTCIIIDNFCTVCWWKLPKFLAEFRLASERVGILVATLMHFLHVVNTLGGWTIGPLAPVWPRSASFSRLGVNHEYNPEILGDEPFRKLSTHGLTPRNIFGKRSWNRIRFFNSDRVAIRKCLTLCFVMS